jgi:hypothetical protein
MTTSARAIATAAALGAICMPFAASAFNSGSTGVDGAFAPTVNTTVPLPPSGIFNFTSVTIPAGVTVKFQRNATNTPVVILASGDVTVGGTLDVRGEAAPGVGAAGTGAQGDDGQPGKGGPGGFDGGKGGIPAVAGFGGTALGPGAGNPGRYVLPSGSCTEAQGWASGGTGGGFSVTAANSVVTSYTCNTATPPYAHTQALGGAGYGSSVLLPLIGGSGGGGGGGGLTFDGGGGGGGGGAILIAASGTVTVTGALLADGGAGATATGAGIGGAGGGGAGGAIRIMATTIAGNGSISAAAGPRGDKSGQTPYNVYDATAGAPGRIRLEGDTITRTAATNPLASADLPRNVFVAGAPTLTISSVAGVNAPTSPTGNADITLPASTQNPVAVVFTTSGVPVGNTILLTVTPALGTKVTAITPALTGSTASATASTTVTLPLGPSVLSAQTTYTVVAAVGDLLRTYAADERVEKVTLVATLGGKSHMKLITVSGKEYDAPDEALRIAAMGG